MNETSNSWRTGMLAAVLAGGVVIGVAATMVLTRTPGTDEDAALMPAEESEADRAAALAVGIVEIGEAAQANVGMQTVDVEPAMVPVTVEATGVVTPVESRVAHLRPLARGIVEQVQVGLGDRVRVGQPLVEYDNVELGDLIGEYRSARAALRQAEAELEVRRQYFERAEALITIEAIAQQTLEMRRAEFDRARAAIGSARADVSRIEERIHRFGLTDADLAAAAADGDGSADALHREASHNVIRAPFDGIVTAYEVAVGEVVAPDRELLTVTDLSTVWVLADVYEDDLGRVRTGTDAVVRTRAYPDRTFTGAVTYISDAIEPSTRTARVRVVVDNTDGALKQEMFVTVSIPSVEAREALAVPISAVQQIDGQPVVFAQTGSTVFQRRDVQLGATAAGRVAVIAGLEPGERVVTEGSFHLKSTLLQDRIGGED